MKNRIKFYSRNDMALGLNLERAEMLIGLKELDINDLIELVNLKKHVDDKIFLKSWDDYFIEKLKDKVSNLNGTIGYFFGKMERGQLKSCYDLLEIGYKEDFIELIKLGLINNKNYKIEIESIIGDNRESLHYFLSSKRLAGNFKTSLRNVILKNPIENIDYILESFESLKKEKRVYCIPDNFFTDEEKETALKAYIESEEISINNLELIHLLKEKIDPKIQLKAKKKYDNEIQRIFQKSQGVYNKIRINFEEMNDDSKFESIEDGFQYSYDLKWLNKYFDFPTILNNFIYLFNYVDKHFRIELVSKINNSGTFERHFRMSNIQKIYNKNSVFNHMEMLSEIQLNMYCDFLQSKNIRIEDVIKWFFKEYLKEEFEIYNFSIEVPSEGSNYMEKCSTLITNLERVFKIYNLYVDDKEIELKLLHYHKSSLKFPGIKSLINRKYIYLNKRNDSTKLVSIMNLLFSDQNTLSFVKDYKYKTFFDALVNEKLLKKDFHDYNYKSLDYLIKEEILEINKSEEIIIKSFDFIYVLKELYYNDVLNYWKCPQNVKDKIDYLLKEGMLINKSSLFSIPEQDYFSYYFNNEKFINTLALRNHYGHGSIPEIEDEGIHYSNYLKILKLMILAIIKINDDIDTYNNLG